MEVSIIFRILRYINLKTIKVMKTLKNLSINLKHYRPFYYFNSESRLNILNKDTMIKINGITHYKFK